MSSSAKQNQSKGGKPNRSSGQQGPSQKTQQPPPKKKGGKRRGGRSRRRRQKEDQISDDTKLYSATSGGDFKTFFRAGGPVKHKEWGLGCRFAGVSVFGRVSTTAGQSALLTTTVARQVTEAGVGTTYFDPYESIPNGNIGSVAFGLHPALVTRLQNECYNWGRYCYRNISVHFAANSSTTNPDGYVAGITHEVTWPLMEDQSGIGGTINDFEVAAMENHASGSFWKNFTLKSADHRGDRTWPTGLPTYFLPEGETNNNNGTFMVPFVEDTQQFCLILRALGAAAATAGGLGFLYVKYVVDFYSPKTQASYFIEETTVPIAPPAVSLRRRRALGRLVPPISRVELPPKEVKAYSTTSLPPSKTMWSDGTPVGPPSKLLRMETKIPTAASSKVVPTEKSLVSKLYEEDDTTDVPRGPSPGIGYGRVNLSREDRHAATLLG